MGATKTKTIQKSKRLKDLEDFAYKKQKEKYPSFPYPTRPIYKDNTANGLTRCVIDSITFFGFQAERINSMGRPVNTEKETALGSVGGVKWIKGTSTKGTADISATIKGRAVKIEIKCKATKDNYQSQDQKNYQKEIEKAGGIYLIVRDYESFYNWYKDFVRNER